MERSTNKNMRGFTLIELMIVVAILMVLAAIALPQFSAYRTRGYNSSALADLKNASTGQEAYYVDHQVYADTETDLTGSYGLLTSQNVTLQASGTADTYSIVAWHSRGDKTYTTTGVGVITSN